jgi:hypothetical protein
MTLGSLCSTSVINLFAASIEYLVLAYFSKSSLSRYAFDTLATFPL